MKHKIEIAPNNAIYIDGERTIGSKPYGLFLTTTMIVSDDDLERLADRCLAVIADRKTENSSEIPNNCEWSVEYAKEMLNTMPCEECGHWEHGAGDHYYCALLEMRQECCFESKGESTLMFANIPQTERSE